MTSKAEPLNKPIVTPAFIVLLGLSLIAGCIVLYRFLFGLGAATALSDGYPWGLWIAFDVVVGTALGCGGYAVALLIYVLNRWKYHPLIRPAILTSLLGYGLAGFAVVIDVGRYWLLYRVLMPWRWNLNSVLLEVAMCIMAYVVVLFIEFLPAVLEKGKESDRSVLKRWSLILHSGLNKAFPFIVALGILLPTMHQSSLGSLMIIAKTKLHPLWHTPLLPLLFLLSCIAMGYAVVIIESFLSSEAFGRPRETKMLLALSRPMLTVVSLYIVLRVVDVSIRNRISEAFSSGFLSFMFWIELALFVVPLVLLARKPRKIGPGVLFLSAFLMVLGGGLYRFDTYLVAFNPGPEWTYFPSVSEIFVSLGIVSFEIMVYSVAVKLLPVFEQVEAKRKVVQEPGQESQPVAA